MSLCHNDKGVEYLLVIKSCPRRESADVTLYVSVCDNNNIPVPRRAIPHFKGIYDIKHRDTPSTRSEVLAQKDTSGIRYEACAPSLTWF